MSGVAVCPGTVSVVGSGPYSLQCDVPFEVIGALTVSMEDAALIGASVATSFAVAWCFRILAQMVRR